MMRVKQLPCAARILLGHCCNGPIEAHHAGRRPIGRKCDDRETIPLCSLAHRHRTNRIGLFRAWKPEALRAWENARIAETQARLAREVPEWA